MVMLQQIATLQEPTHTEAQRWLTALLAEADVLFQYDRYWTPHRDTPECVNASRELRKAGRQWATEAEDLLNRLRPMRKALVPDFDRLFDSLGFMLARLATSAEPHRDDEVLIPHEEVRREFLDRLARHREGSVRRASDSGPGSNT